jgi:hypothetical protein
MQMETLRRHFTFSFLIRIGHGFAQISYQVNKGPFTPTVARIVGIVLSGICLVFFASVMFFPSAYV